MFLIKKLFGVIYNYFTYNINYLDNIKRIYKTETNVEEPQTPRNFIHARNNQERKKLAEKLQSLTDNKYSVFLRKIFNFSDFYHF